MPLPLSLPLFLYSSLSPSLSHSAQFSGHKSVRGRGLFSTCICEINADYAAIFMPWNEAENQFQQSKKSLGREGRAEHFCNQHLIENWALYEN